MELRDESSFDRVPRRDAGSGGRVRADRPRGRRARPGPGAPTAAIKSGVRVARRLPAEGAAPADTRGRNAGMDTPVGAGAREELSRDPYPVYRRLREEGACVWLDAANRYVVPRWEDVVGLDELPGITAREEPSLMT